MRVATGVQVATSRYWQTNSGLITTTSGIVLVDAGVLPHEMESLAQVAGARHLRERAAFDVGRRLVVSSG